MLNKSDLHHSSALLRLKRPLALLYESITKDSTQSHIKTHAVARGINLRNS